MILLAFVKIGKTRKCKDWLESQINDFFLLEIHNQPWIQKSSSFYVALGHFIRFLFFTCFYFLFWQPIEGNVLIYIKGIHLVLNWTTVKSKFKMLLKLKTKWEYLMLISFNFNLLNNVHAYTTKKLQAILKVVLLRVSIGKYEWLNQNKFSCAIKKKGSVWFFFSNSKLTRDARRIFVNNEREIFL